MTSPISASKEILDRHWLESAFFMRFDNISERRENSLRRTNLSMAFHDTSLGGNASINPKYQVNSLCDPKGPKLSISSNGQGMMYNEMIDENAQRIWIQAGHMEFNSISAFLRSSYNYKQAYLANKGQVASSLYTIGQGIGFLSTLPLQVFFGLNYLYRRIVGFITKRPYSRFAYLTPTMALYWAAVTTMFNKITANMNITAGLSAEDIKEYNENSLDATNIARVVGNIDAFAASMPDTFKLTGDRLYIDLMAVSSKGQRLANQYYEAITDIRNSSSSPSDYATNIQKYMNSRLSIRNSESFKDIDGYIKQYMNDYGAPTEPVEAATANDVESVKARATAEPQITMRDKAPGFKDFLMAELRDGSAFVSFVVENQGSISETLTNDTKPTELEGMINGVAQRARDMFVNFAGGNIGDGFIGDAVETVIGGVGALLNGALDSVGLGGLGNLGGSALTEINEVYDNSSMSKDGGSFTIKLATPYGNKISILQDIYAPLCMLLALALPKATGKSSYTSPFCLRVYSPGRIDYKLAMIKNMTITRGTSNIGFVKQSNLPTAIEVTFDVEDLNNVMAMPLATSLLSDALSFSYFDEDSPMQDYLSALSGMGLYEQFYINGRIATGVAQTKIAFAQMNSPATLASKIGYSSVGEVVKAFTMGAAIVQ